MSGISSQPGAPNDGGIVPASTAAPPSTTPYTSTASAQTSTPLTSIAAAATASVDAAAASVGATSVGAGSYTPSQTSISTWMPESSTLATSIDTPTTSLNTWTSATSLDTWTSATSTWAAPTTSSTIASVMATTASAASTIPTTLSTISSLVSSSAPSSASSTKTSATSAAASSSATAAATSSKSSTKWIPGVVIGVIVFVAILAGLAFWFIRRRRSQKYHQVDHGAGAPLAPPDMFGYRRPLMDHPYSNAYGQAQSHADAEQERRDLIRKSMITRSSWCASDIDLSAAAAATTAAPAARDENAGLRDDYKETQMQRQKALLAEQHPSMQETEFSQVPQVSHVETPRGRLRIDTRIVSPLPIAPPREETFTVSPVSSTSVPAPAPARSRQRTSSTGSADSARTVTQHNASTENNTLNTIEPTTTNTRSRRSTRGSTRNPHTRLMSADAASPSSLYSVDLLDGRQNRAWANYHHDED